MTCLNMTRDASRKCFVGEFLYPIYYRPQKIGIKQSILHENYDDFTFENDLALLDSKMEKQFYYFHKRSHTSMTART